MSLRSILLDEARAADSHIAAVAKETGIDGYEVRQAFSAATRFIADALILDKRKLPKRIPGISRKLEKAFLDNIRVSKL